MHGHQKVGLLLELSKTIGPLDVMYFDCSSFDSALVTSKQPILFFGGKTLLRIENIMDLLFKHRLDESIVQVQALLDMIRGHRIKGSSHTELLSTHFEAMRVILRNILHCHSGQDADGYVMDLVMFNLRRTSEIRLLYHDLLTKYQGLQCIFKKKDSDFEVLDIANIAVLFMLSQKITFVLGDADFIGETAWRSMVNQVAVIYDIGLTTTICFEFPSQLSWHQDMLFNAAFTFLPQRGSEWECHVKVQENVLSFEVKANGQNDAMQYEKIQSLCTQILANSLKVEGRAGIESIDQKEDM